MKTTEQSALDEYLDSLPLSATEREALADCRDFSELHSRLGGVQTAETEDAVHKSAARRIELGAGESLQDTGLLSLDSAGRPAESSESRPVSCSDSPAPSSMRRAADLCTASSVSAVCTPPRRLCSSLKSRQSASASRSVALSGRLSRYSSRADCSVVFIGR